MAAAGMPDDQIGAVWNVTGQTIYNVRLRLGIASNVRKKRKTMQEIFDALVPAALEPVEVYTDEAGRTVKRYPARYAEGAGTQAVTARPRR